MQFYKNLGRGYRMELDDVLTLPPALRLVIQRLTHPNPGRRYQTAWELAQALQDGIS